MVFAKISDGFSIDCNECLVPSVNRTGILLQIAESMYRLLLYRQQIDNAGHKSKDANIEVMTVYCT